MPASHSHTPFRLKPKHLINAVLGICLLAIAIVAVGIFGTFNRQDTEAVRTEQQTQVELWKPGKGNSQTATVGGQDLFQPQPPAEQNDSAESDTAAADAPLPPPRRVAPKPKPRPRETAATTERSGVETAEPAAVAENRETPIRAIHSENRSESRRETQPVRHERSEVKSEPKPQPKAEHRHESRAEPKAHKDVIDNLF
ncbi:hypothetical protein L4G92_07535 [Neisseria sp. ZJ106]|uniref:Uncharacterized protein n=1 Tax=Neisseria lisongii TaxID=2912188 RepID=A0ABY7RIG7_9NEIS|nr:hypothetical protein [Neisseria lisongii]MCF7521896.1 hypothetical protein [Neisseria lisongii]WCL71142.1 hypothetical protein PJU73_07295 [Neisseria lisongii]